MWAHLLGKLCKNTDDLMSLITFQFPDTVVGFHDYSRFDKHRTSRSTLVMDDAWNPALQPRGHRDNKPPVAQGWRNVFLDKTFTLSIAQNAVKCFGDGSFCSGQFMSDVVEFRGSRVSYLPMLVKNLVDTLNEGWKSNDPLS